MPQDPVHKKTNLAPLYLIYKDVMENMRDHQFMAMNASVAFFTLFAIIPLMLLVIFIFGHWLNESAIAYSKVDQIIKLLLPELSESIMGELKLLSGKRFAWEIVWVFVLFLGSTPLTSNLKSCIRRIFGEEKKQFFVINKLLDIISVIVLLSLFIVYAFTNIFLDDVALYVSTLTTMIESQSATTFTSSILLIVVMTFFYQLFIPVKIELRHLILGAFITSISWLILSEAFEFFTSLSAMYGSFFGGMRNIFISVIWLYLNCAAILVSLEIIASVHNQDLILIKQLFFKKNIHRQAIFPKLWMKFGQKQKKDHILYKEGDHDRRLFYIVEGEIGIVKKGKRITSLKAGEYFGELASLGKIPRQVSAYVMSDWARLLIIDDDKLDRLVDDNHQISLRLLKTLAKKVQAT